MKKYLLLVLLISLNVNANFNFSKDYSFKNFDIEKFKQELTSVILGENTWPENLKVAERSYVIDYSINKELEQQIKRYLKEYRSDYTSVVVIDNNTGKLISVVDYDKKEDAFGRNLSFSNLNPAASIFKVITAADLLENTDISKETEFSFTGRSSTLYKYQLGDKKNKWTRSTPFKNAFAKSNNVVFGKAAINNSSTSSLTTMANKFGFNNDVLQLLDIGESKVKIAEDDYGLAELASGFNKQTTISPLHGAIIASVIANDGVLKKPTVINSIIDEKQNREVWKPKYVFNRVISEEVADEIKDMMQLTVKAGTARGAFRPWKIKKLKEIEIGGKTGHITGGIPYGKRDWFVSYARPVNDTSDKGISVCVMIVNVKRWYVKSTYLAKKIIQYYYDDLKK